MLKCLLMVVGAAWLASLFGCNRKPKVVTIDQLSFPVVRILESSTERKDRSHARIFVDKEDLSRIPVQELWNVAEPLVIDSNANVFEMKNIKNEHGGLWIMINPSGQMPVQFELLQRKETGIEAARDLIANCRFLGRDLDNERTELRRERIHKATKGKEIIQIICEDPLPSTRVVKIDKPNDKGFAKISIRDGIEVPE